jgi:hypothetical protein
MTICTRMFVRYPIAFVLAGAGIHAARAAGEPLRQIVAPKDGAGACYRRVYDPAHLKRNPRQQTTEALLSFRYQGNDGAHIESIMLKRRAPQPPLVFAGGCEWNPTSANIDTSGNRMIKAFTGRAGYDCIVVSSPGSAEEGGYFLIDLPADGKSAMLYLDNQIAPWRAGRKGDHAVHVDLGRDDRVFRLERTDAAACRALEEATKDAP